MYKYFILFLGICTGLLFVSKSDFSIAYADSGFMWIQIIDLIQSKFTTFSFLYAGQNFDPTGEFLPFVKPFIGGYQGKFYIDFPPYFPLLASLPRFILENDISIYLLELVGISLGLFSFFLIIDRYVKKTSTSILVTIILLFGTTIFTYNLTIHEYSIAIGLLYSGFYFLLPREDKNTSSIYFSALLLGASLFFRLEFIFPIFSWLLILVIYKKYTIPFITVRFGILFSGILLTLFLLNQYIHGHPLGFRYLLTMHNPDTIVTNRSGLVFDLLFGQIRGFFYQSSYLLLFLGIGTIQTIYARVKRTQIHKEQEYYLVISILIFVLISFTAPNHGDHISPRYLFGIYPSLFIFSYFTYQNTKKSLSKIKLTLFNILIFVLILFSTKQLYNNIKFVSNADKMVRSVTDIVDRQEEKNIVFLDQVLAKNLQTLNLTKNLYYSELEHIPDFIKISNLDTKDVLFISSEYSDQCLLDTLLCQDRPGFMNMNFYIISK